MKKREKIRKEGGRKEAKKDERISGTTKEEKRKKAKEKRK